MEDLTEKVTFEQRLGKGGLLGEEYSWHELGRGLLKPTGDMSWLVLWLRTEPAGDTVGASLYLFGTNLCQHLRLCLRAFAGFWYKEVLESECLWRGSGTDGKLVG